MISSWGLALKKNQKKKTREKSLPEQSIFSEHLHRGRQPVIWTHFSLEVCCLHDKDAPVQEFNKFFFLLWTHHTHAHTQQSHLVSNVCRLLHSVAMCVFTALKYQKSAITCSSPIKTARSCSSKGTWSSPAQRQSLFRFLDMTAKVLHSLPPNTGVSVQYRHSEKFYVVHVQVLLCEMG